MHPLDHHGFSTYYEIGTFITRTSMSIYRCIRRVFNCADTLQTTNISRRSSATSNIVITKLRTHSSNTTKENSDQKTEPSNTSTNGSLIFEAQDNAHGPLIECKGQVRKRMFSETIEGSALSEIMLSGVFGEVIIDDECVIKKFKKLAEIDLPDEEKAKLNIDEMAQDETAMFNLYYGDGAAKLFYDGDKICIKMTKIEGKTLEAMDESDLQKAMREGVKAFYQMMAKLFSLNIIHADFLLKNIMFYQGVFFPIDITNSDAKTYESNLSIMQNITAFIQNEYESIKLEWKTIQGATHVALKYINNNDGELSCVSHYTFNFTCE